MPKSTRRQNRENGHTHRQTHRTTTVTLAAHARRGLITSQTLKTVERVLQHHEGGQLFNPLTTNYNYSRPQTSATSYQLAQSILRIGSALAERGGGWVHHSGWQCMVVVAAQDCRKRSGWSSFGRTNFRSLVGVVIWHRPARRAHQIGVRISAACGSGVAAEHQTAATSKLVKVEMQDWSQDSKASNDWSIIIIICDTSLLLPVTESSYYSPLLEPLIANQGV